MSDISLSWVLPMYRTSEALTELVERVHRVSKQLEVSYEILLIDDDCPEGSGDIARAKFQFDNHVVVVSLDHNKGQDEAVVCGVKKSRGDWVVVHDADLQDPPEAVQSLWEAKTGYDVVFAHKTGGFDVPFRRWSSLIYRLLLRLISGLPYGAGLFVLMSRNVADQLKARHKPNVPFIAVLGGCTMSATSVRIKRTRRPIGNSAYTSKMRVLKAFRTLCCLLCFKLFNGSKQDPLRSRR